MVQFPGLSCTAPFKGATKLAASWSAGKEKKKQIITKRGETHEHVSVLPSNGGVFPFYFSFFSGQLFCIIYRLVYRCATLPNVMLCFLVSVSANPSFVSPIKATRMLFIFAIV